MNIENKAKTGQFIIDTESNQITFTDVRYYADGNGNFFPSVTTVLDAFPKGGAFLQWLKENGKDADDIRDAAGVKGSRIHNLIERYNNGEVVSLMDADGMIRYSSAEWAGLEKWVEFNRRFQPTILKSEFNIVSPELKTAGTIDCVMEFEGKKYIVDFKTSNAIHDTYYMQLAAYKKLYQLAFPDDHIDGCAILWLSAKTRTEGKKGQYQGKGYQLLFPEKPLDHYWNLFLHCQALWEEVNQDAKPNNISYTLEHKK